MDSSEWEELRRSLLVDPTAEQHSRSPRRPARRERADGPAPWGAAVLTHLIGLAVLMGTTLVGGFLVVLLVLWIGLSGGADEVSLTQLLTLAVTPFVVGLALSVVAQARYLQHRGFRPPWLAPIGALGAEWLVGWLAGPLSLPTPVEYVLPSVVAILVLVRLIRPTR